MKPSPTNEDTSHYRRRPKGPSDALKWQKGRKVLQQPANELGGCLRRKPNPSAVPDDTDRRQGKNDPRWAAQLSRLFAALRGQPARARCRPALHTKGPEGATARQRRSERTRQIHQPQGGRHPDQLAESSHPKGKRGPSGITSAAPLKPNGGLPPWKPTGTPLPEGDPHGYQTQRLPTQTHRP